MTKTLFFLLLLTAPCVANKPSGNGNYPMHKLYEKRRKDLQSGRYVAQQDLQNENPHPFSVFIAGNARDVENLLNTEYDPNTRSRGTTGLFYAAMHGNKDAVSILLKRGANTDPHSMYFGPPLSFAVYYGYVEIVKLLLE